MQGIECSGVIMWSVYRNDDGPFRAYKAFGTDLQSYTPSVANGKIESIAVSIVRDKIANLTINDMIKNRNKIRAGIKDEMQKILTGWGLWLETIEIQDVKISSASLFKNLQCEFREKTRMDSERIEADTQNTISGEKLVRDKEFNELKTET